LTRDEIPVTDVLNIYVPSDLSTESVDTIQYYRGDRDVEEGDSSLTENAGEEDSSVFHGIVNGFDTTVTIVNFTGLTTSFDTLTATIEYVNSGKESSFSVDFTETDTESNVFRATMDAPDPGTFVANLYIPANLNGQAGNSLQHFGGQRLALPCDPVFAGAVAENGFLEFDGSLTLPGEPVPTKVTIESILLEHPANSGDFVWTVPGSSEVVFDDTRAVIGYPSVSSR
jgi:hypothetical protein